MTRNKKTKKKRKISEIPEAVEKPWSTPDERKKSLWLEWYLEKSGFKLAVKKSYGWCERKCNRGSRNEVSEKRKKMVGLAPTTPMEYDTVLIDNCQKEEVFCRSVARSCNEKEVSGERAWRTLSSSLYTCILASCMPVYSRRWIRHYFRRNVKFTQASAMNWVESTIATAANIAIATQRSAFTTSAIPLWHCWLGLLTHKTRPRYDL